MTDEKEKIRIEDIKLECVIYCLGRSVISPNMETIGKEVHELLKVIEEETGRNLGGISPETVKRIVRDHRKDLKPDKGFIIDRKIEAKKDLSKGYTKDGDSDMKKRSLKLDKRFDDFDLEHKELIEKAWDKLHKITEPAGQTEVDENTLVEERTNADFNIRKGHTEKIQENIIKPWIENLPVVHENGYVLPPGKDTHFGDKLVDKNPLFDGDKVWSPKYAPLREIEDEPLYADLVNHPLNDESLLDRWEEYKELCEEIYENYTTMLLKTGIEFKESVKRLLKEEFERHEGVDHLHVRVDPPVSELIIKRVLTRWRMKRGRASDEETFDPTVKHLDIPSLYISTCITIINEQTNRIVVTLDLESKEALLDDIGNFRYVYSPHPSQDLSSNTESTLKDIFDSALNQTVERMVDGELSGDFGKHEELIHHASESRSNILAILRRYNSQTVLEGRCEFIDR